MFRRVLSLFLFISLCAVSYIWSEPRPLILSDLFRMRRVSEPVLSPDGKWIVFTVASPDLAGNKLGTDLWMISIEGQMLRQLTNSPAQDRHAAWSPDGKWVAFESTRSGKSQIWLISSEGGEAKQFTNISTEASTPVWSPDGKRIAFVSAVFPEFSEKPFKESNELNQKKLEEQEKALVKARVINNLLYRHWDSWVDGKRQHIFIQPWAGGDPIDLTPGNRDAIPTASIFSGGIDFTFSPGGDQIAYTATPNENEAWNTNHDIYQISVNGGKPGVIVSTPAAEGYPRYSPDGKYISYRAQTVPGYESDRWQLFIYDRTSGQTRSLTENMDISIESPFWAPDGKSLFFTAEEKGNFPIFRVNTSGSREVKKLIDRGTNEFVRATPDGKTILFTNNTFTRPAEIYKAGADGRNLLQLTRMNDEVFSGLDISSPENITYTGEGGTPVQAWLFKPPLFNPGKKYPLILMVHGGPHSSWLDNWSFEWNLALWSAQGYVVMAPNPRGSSGFGQKFSNEVIKDWGGKVFVDLMKGVDYAETLPYVDKDRMAAAGASYGGYMINWIEGNTDRFKTLICHEGTFNLYSKYGTTDEVWFNQWEHGIPWENAAGYDKYSPHRYAANFKTPMLMIYNELDYRVPVSEGMQLFTYLQRKGVPSKWLYFPDEGHWVEKPANSEFWYRTIFDWLTHYLKP